MIKRYASEKGMWTMAVFMGTLLLLCFPIVMWPQQVLRHAGVPVAVLFIATMFAWMWFGTSYKLDGQYFYYASGPFRGKIELSAIRQVVKRQTLWYGYRPALACNGIIIRYGSWEEIYISPKAQDEFVDALIARNASIVVT